MADRDPAFQWETEALRAAARRRRESQTPPPTPGSIDPGWVTMRQAAGATGIPVGTLRRWARQGALPSRSQETESGTRRLVWLEAVLERARLLGRIADRAQADSPSEPLRERSAPPPPPPRPQPHWEPPPEIPGQQQLVDTPAADDSSREVAAVEPVTDEEGTAADEWEETSQPHPQSPVVGVSKTAPPDPPPGTMLVPVDAWNKMLMQLGNLHEAGRELAEARERAAKAETEATFLRERLKELRERSENEASPVVGERKRRRWFRG